MEKLMAILFKRAAVFFLLFFSRILTKMFALFLSSSLDTKSDPGRLFSPLPTTDRENDSALSSLVDSRRIAARVFGAALVSWGSLLFDFGARTSSAPATLAASCGRRCNHHIQHTSIQLFYAY